MATAVPMGIVSLKAEGAYAADKLYKKGMWVTSSGSSYAYINPTPSTGVSLTETTHWQQIASQGMTGPSAYDAAVAGEYTGTEEDFNAANAGIEAARNAALGAAETANEAAENAETAAYRSTLWRKTASGNPVSVYPVPESPLYPKVSGTFTQEGTGDPSPENIRPITPWLESGGTVKVKRTGKNLLQSGGGVSHSSNGIVITKNANGSLTINGTSTGTVFYNINDLYPITLPPGNYYQTTGNADVNISTRYVSPNITIKSGNGAFSVSVEQSVPCFSYLSISTGLTFANVIVYPQLELGSVATPYEPYSGQEISLTAPQEIAAGWMDNEGKGQVTHGYIASYVDEAVPDGWVSSIGELSAGAQVVYPLATPIDITPTAAPLISIPQLDSITPRQNVLTASTGSVEMTYAKSPIREADELAVAGDQTMEQAASVAAQLAEIVTSEKSVNIFDKNSSEIEMQKYIDANGNFIEVVSTNYKISGYTPASPVKNYTIQASASVIGNYDANAYKTVIAYDSAKVKIGKVTGVVSGDSTYYTITTPTNTAFIRFNVYTNIDVLMVVEGTLLPVRYVPYRQIRILNSILLSRTEMQKLNPLYQKTIVWDGDSIMAGNAFNDNQSAWAGRIASRNDMVYKNYAAGGGTITKNVVDGNGVTKHSVCNTLASMQSEYPDADYVIVNGGCNDADLIGSILSGGNPARFGSFSDSDYGGTYDEDTFCGALESIFYRMTNLWNGKKFGYIIPHKMGVSVAGYKSDVNNYRAYFDVAINICKKWGVRYLDLWETFYFCPMVAHLCDTYQTLTIEQRYAANMVYADRQHLTAHGYDIESQVVEAWLKTL